jgi:tRNA(Ile2) C34 agmatinyltransferase TiaS
VRADHGLDDEVGTYEVETPKRVLTRNAVCCDKCGEVIESLHRHDFKWCSCGSVAVDGGLDYTKRATQEGATFTELSEWA